MSAVTVGSERWFPGNSEMAQRMRALDWLSTDLGPPDSWPEHFQTSVRLCLTSRIPVVMYWGPAFTVLYNDPYISFLGEAKHPGCLGRPGHEVWSEIWDTIGPMLHGVYETREATWSEDLRMFFARRRPLEEVYVRFTFGPILDADGRAVGIFCPCTETTERVIAERRLDTLRKLGVKAATAQSVGAACEEAARALGENPQDVPFAGIYVVEGNTTDLRLAATAGLPVAHPLPAVVAGGAAHGLGRPLATVLAGRVAEGPFDLTELRAAVSGQYPEPTSEAIVLPIAGTSHNELTGLLVAGISPRRVFDDSYRGFFDLVAGHIGTAIADANAYEAERRRAETLAELDRAKTAFFSNVSHEFRTPLTLLLGPLEDGLADAQTPLSPAQRERLEVAHRNALRLLRLVNTLLDFSRIEAGRVDAVYEPSDIAALTADIASVFRSAVEKAGLRLAIDCPPLPEPAFLDREMWEKIVLNLMSNAFKFTFDGEIHVSVRAAGDRAELVVRDTGIGIPQHELPHVFERFHRIRDARGRTHEGTGIGLALVQELVKLHRGTVSVDSVVGGGTAFTVAIPFGSNHLPADRIGAGRARVSAALAAAPYVEEALRWLPDEIVADSTGVTTSHMTRGARVLLADDNADMRDYVRRLLSAHWTVQAVSDGQAALEVAFTERPDLVLADVMMPQLDGFGLLRALRADVRTRNIPIILLSARAGEESRVEGLEAGADDYLVKPFSTRELVARVNAHLELARVRQDALDREQAARTIAEQANRAKDEFLLVLSHELRTPLNAILGWSVMLKNDHADHPAAVSRGLEVIERNARIQAQLIEDLLDVSRIVSGKLRLDVRPMDLTGAIHAALDAARPAAAAKEIRLQPILDPKAGLVSGDPERLQQVLSNLLSNAVKFTPKGGRVQVRLERMNSHIEIVVSDNGSGIAPDLLPHIFDRFRQADSSTTRRHGGLGLGLALVKNLVELHGGSVRAESAGPGNGATFVVELPMLAQVASDLPREHPTARRVTLTPNTSLIAGLRLLIVDDEPETLELFKKLFAECGAEIVVAESAARALEEFERHRPDVLISDIEMPGEDGYSLIRRVRAFAAANGGTVPAVAVTAYGSVDDRIRLLAAGFQMHVPKPVDPAELVTVVASVAGRTGR